MDIEITLTAAPTEEHSDAPQNDHHDRRGRRTPSPVRGEPSTLPPCIIDIPQPKLHRSPSPVRAIPRSKFPFPLHPVHDAQEAFRNRHGDVLATQIRAIFSASTPPALNESQFQDVTVACQAPRYFNRVFFHRCGGKPGGVVTLDGFERFWNTLRNCADVEEMCFWILGGGKSMLTEEDFGLLIQDVVHNHPGLEFLKRMDVFQLRYVETIIARIFYSKTRNTNPRMSLREFRKDRIYHTILNLQQTEDINASRDVFSYKHFYVIYCKFWELDSDHDLFIMEDALRQYENGCLSHLAVSRIFSGAGRGIGKFDAMSYKEFIRFILAVEDKDTPQGIEYWFRCLDTDGDGVWSLWELKMFYEEQRARMREFRMADPWDWDDFSCAILDLVNPVTPGQIRLSDLKRCKSAGLVFDMLFDIRKYDLYLRRIDPSFREWDDMYVEDRETKEKVLLEYVMTCASSGPDSNGA
ncbi:uncharacterized protein EV422DRAFT_139601 [Fimicolochytrium jonesii]|uniref:uncharacterized protein n=1 Tax=Fimicolochytrium jonesii TaxID=1396493 RepID=UPI0022FF397E|nr:uncharacterized protein EV422DRAFT_139601 [Fimicolochytrium jonesii]KAI8825757.1 hypothetical protein EV422DRAFT_139601 [Fimicolochytrium jonesii]